MCLARPSDLLRSFALRTTLLTALVVLLITGLGLGFGYWRSERMLRENLDAALRAEAVGLLTVQRASGTPGLVAEVAQRAQLRSGSAIVATLQTLDGRRVAGAPLDLPPSLSGFGTVTSPASGQLRALGIIVPGGLNLVIAAEMRAVLDTAATLAQALMLAGAAAVLLAPLFGLFLARRMQRRLTRVAAATEAVIGGDLSRRLPLTGAGDEFDRLASTINLALTRVEALVTGLRQVTDDVAHDLRTPLARLRQRLEQATARARDPHADQATLEAAIAELDALLATFGALLRLAQLESRTDTPTARVDLSALTTTITETYAAIAEDQGKVLRAQIAPGQAVHGDADLLRQALVNLIENALLHGGTGIDVHLASGPVLSVTDDGPGIADADRERVLGRFVRLDGSRNAPGSGLGLALVVTVARLHHTRPVLEDAGPGLRVTLDLTGVRAAS